MELFSWVTFGKMVFQTMRYENLMPNSVQVNHLASNETSEAILEAATELFLERGYKATSVRDIATAANVTHSLVPHYFKSKEELARLICYEQVEQVWAEIDSQTEALQLACGEKLYVSDCLMWRYVDHVPRFNKFYLELFTTTTLADEVSVSYINMCLDVIARYGLSVTPQKNLLYVSVMSGAAKRILSGRKQGLFDLSYVEISNLLISNYFFNIGLPDEEIAKIIHNGGLALQRLRQKEGYQ